MQETVVIQLTSNDGQEPHQIIKDYVAEKMQTRDFDACFDKCYELGLSNGTAMYDRAMNYTLATIGITPEEVINMLRTKGVAV